MWQGILSPYLVTIAVTWSCAHIIKCALSLNKNEKIKFRSCLFVSGGMPSSHSATTVALMTIIGLCDGVGSALFGLATMFALIVMYDAMKVRRSSGEQGETIRALIKEQKSAIKLPRVVKGHTPIEVLAGAFLGLIIGIVVFLLTIK